MFGIMNWCILEFSCYLTALFNNLSANCPSISVNFLQNKLRERITQTNSKILSILNSECRLYQFHYIITDSKTGESEKGKIQPIVSSALKWNIFFEWGWNVGEKNGGELEVNGGVRTENYHCIQHCFSNCK